MVKLYEYKACTTCKKAARFIETHLEKKGVKVERIPIVEQPPTLAELKKMLTYIKASGGTFKKLFNTSGVLYRELRIGEKIRAGMTEAEGLNLLAKHGKLIKRPFLLTSTTGTVGFQEDTWKKLLPNLRS